MKSRQDGDVDGRAHVCEGEGLVLDAGVETAMTGGSDDDGRGEAQLSTVPRCRREVLG